MMMRGTVDLMRRMFERRDQRLAADALARIAARTPKENAMAVSERDERLVRELEENHPTYNGWTFDFMYPGLFSYCKGDETHDERVFFTPDYHDPGQLSMQVATDDYIDVPWPEVVYPEPLTSEFLFEQARALMDHLDDSEGAPMLVVLPTGKVVGSGPNRLRAWADAPGSHRGLEGTKCVPLAEVPGAGQPGGQCITAPGVPCSCGDCAAETSQPS
jgi:hypothetical protein